MKQSFEIRLFNVIKKYFLIMIIGALLISGVAVWQKKAKFVQRYHATTAVLIAAAEGYKNDSLDEINRNQQLVPTYVKIARSSTALEIVRQDERFAKYSVNRLRSMMSLSESVSGTYIDIVARGEKGIVVPLSIKFAESLKEAGVEIRGVDYVQIISIPSAAIKTNKFEWQRTFVSTLFISLFFFVVAFYFKDNIFKKRELKAEAVDGEIDIKPEEEINQQ